MLMSFQGKLKLVFFGLWIICCQKALMAQSAIPYGLYFNNWKVVNPASTGLIESQKFDVAYRANNTKLSGNPSNVLISYEHRLSQLNSGLGIIFENKQLGVITIVSAKALYNYQIELGEESKLSIGTGMSFLSTTFDELDLLDRSDAAIITNLKPTTAFDLDFGVSFQSNHFQGGFAIKNLSESKIGRSEVVFTHINERQHLTLYGEYELEYSKFRFIPSIFLFTDYDITFFNFNPTFEFLDFLLIGGTLSASEDKNFVNVNAGLHWKNKIRFMGILFSSGYQGDGRNFEFSWSIIIDKKKESL